MYGQFHIALVNANETTFGPEHELWELDFSRFSLQQAENDFATVSLVIKNPRVGFLNPGRKQWAWLAFDLGDPTGVVPLLFGRIIAIPDDMNKHEVQITFRARPATFNALKLALAESLKVAPYWDRVWIRDEDLENPDLVLQARTALWHIDRIDHTVTISDNIVGEDGVLVFDEEDILENSLSVTASGPAANVARVRAEVRWTQRAVGVVNVAPNLIAAFSGQGTTEPYMISSYTGEGLVSSWPLPGDDFGGGWSVKDSNVEDGNGKWIGDDQFAQNQMTSWLSTQYSVFEPEDLTEVQTEVLVTRWVMKPTLSVEYNAERSRVELIEFDLYADVQAVLSEPGDEDVLLQIDLASNDVSEPIEIDESGNAAAPIGDVRRNSYMRTDRGVESLEYAIARARAELLDHARVGIVKITVKFDNVVNVSLRKNMIVVSDDISGGFATGKIIGYEASASADDGLAYCTITMACCIGYGGALAADAGEPIYCDDDYVQPDYQVHDGQVHLLAAGDVTWNEFRAFPINDDGINFFDVKASDVVEQVLVTNGPATQREVHEGFYNTMAEAVTNLQQNHTRICLHLKPVTGGPYETVVQLTVSDLVVPAQLDLTADAA